MSNALSESLLESEGASEGPPPGRGPSRYLRADTLQVLRKNPRTFKIRASTGGRFRSDKHIESLDCACTTWGAGLSPAKAHRPTIAVCRRSLRKQGQSGGLLPAKGLRRVCPRPLGADVPRGCVAGAARSRARLTPSLQAS